MEKTRGSHIYFDKFYRSWALLQQTAHLISRFRDKELRPLNITRRKVEVLAALQTYDAPPTIGELSKRLSREPHTVSSLVIAMEKQGLVRKVIDNERRVIKRVIITDEGGEILHKALEIKSIRKVLSLLPEKDLDNLRANLRILRNGAREELGKYS